MGLIILVLILQLSELKRLWPVSVFLLFYGYGSFIGFWLAKSLIERLGSSYLYNISDRGLAEAT
jgi:hypothetical protein